MAMLINGLAVLRGECDDVNPHRDRSSDGWIGDDAHALRISDHNPDSRGVVHAIDVTADGLPMAKIVAYLVGRCRAGTETRLQYIIFRRVIWSRSWGWAARGYTGINPHIKHAHFSARYADIAGNTHAWGVAATFGPGAAAAVPPPTPRRAVAHPPGSRELRIHTPPYAGDDVKFVQRWIGHAHCGASDGIYGPDTAAGVRWYQRMRNIAVDGRVGPQTWRNMGVRWEG